MFGSKKSCLRAIDCFRKKIQSLTIFFQILNLTRLKKAGWVKYVSRIIWLVLKTWLIKARLHIPFTHAFTALRCVFLLFTLVCWCLWKKVITSKTQCNEESACGNRMWQLALNHWRSVFGSFDQKLWFFWNFKLETKVWDDSFLMFYRFLLTPVFDCDCRYRPPSRHRSNQSGLLTSMIL